MTVRRLDQVLLDRRVVATQLAGFAFRSAAGARHRHRSGQLRGGGNRYQGGPRRVPLGRPGVAHGRGDRQQGRRGQRRPMMTDEIVGIDLGTTNSEIAIYRDGRPEVLRDEQGRHHPAVGGRAHRDRGTARRRGGAQPVPALSRANRPLDQAADGQRRQGAVLASANTHRKRSRRSSCRG